MTTQEFEAIVKQRLAIEKPAHEDEGLGWIKVVQTSDDKKAVVSVIYSHKFSQWTFSFEREEDDDGASLSVELYGEGQTLADAINAALLQ